MKKTKNLIILVIFLASAFDQTSKKQKNKNLVKKIQVKHTH